MTDQTFITAYVLYCFDPETRDEVMHIFSSDENRQNYADNDRRNHVFMDYLVDDPAHHEEPVRMQ